MAKTVHEIRGAFRDLNCKGKGNETFRKVWRDGSWRWISEALPRGTFLASDRRCATRGPVEEAEIVAEFDRNLPNRKCSIYAFYLVRGELGPEQKPLVNLEFKRDGLKSYAVILPDGTSVSVPDPMAR